MFWIFVSVVVVVLGVWIIADWYMKVEGFERIPGPKGIYLIGNVFDFLMNNVKLFYYFRYFANEYKDIFKGKLGLKNFVVVLKPEYVETVISGSKNTSKGYLYTFLKPWLRDGLLLSDGDKWRERRKLLTPAFHFNVLMNYKLIFEQHGRKLIEQLNSEIEEPKTDISSLLTDFTLNAISETAMGTKLDVQDENSRRYKNGIYKLGHLMIYRAERAWLHINSIFSITQAGREQKQVLDWIGSFRDNIIDKRRQDGLRNLFKECYEGEFTVYKQKRLAMLDLLLKAESEGKIDAEGIQEEVETFMFEGHDTTASCLQFVLMLLANHPVVQDKVYEECSRILGSSDRPATMVELGQIKYMECCIKEALRLYPPVYYFGRYIDSDLELGEYTVPAGTECFVIVFDLHRRQDQFVEPQEFRPERFLVEPTWHPYAYLPFSAGPRNCIGQKFAMLEMKIILVAILRRYRLLPVTKPIDLVFDANFILKTKYPIYVKIEHRT